MITTPTPRQRRAVREHYGLSRWPTDAEVRAEIANCHRKAVAGALCDFAGALWARLQVAGPTPE